MATELTSGERTLITCQQAARLYGCTMGYIRRLARDGRIHSQMMGRTYLLDADEVRRMASGDKKLAKGFAAN
jgi:excisionase family DNA binding protein